MDDQLREISLSEGLSAQTTSVDAVARFGLARRRGSLQHNMLLAEKCHLGFASRMRSEHSDEQSAEPLQEVDRPGDESSPSWQLRQPGCDFR